MSRMKRCFKDSADGRARMQRRLWCQWARCGVFSLVFGDELCVSSSRKMIYVFWYFGDVP